MKFYYHADYLSFNKQREQLLENGSFWNRKKDHVPVMRLHKKINNTQVCILLDKILPRNPEMAHGMVFVEGSFGKPISLNIEKFISHYDYKFDPHFETKFKLSQHLARSFAALNYFNDERERLNRIKNGDFTIDDLEGFLDEFDESLV